MGQEGKEQTGREPEGDPLTELNVSKWRDPTCTVVGTRWEDEIGGGRDWRQEDHPGHLCSDVGASKRNAKEKTLLILNIRLQQSKKCIVVSPFDF